MFITGASVCMTDFSMSHLDWEADVFLTESSLLCKAVVKCNAQV